MNKSRKFAALIVTAIIFCMFSVVARAQEETDDEEHGLYVVKPKVFYGGLVAGGNFAQVDGDNFAGYRKMGVNVGGIVYARLAKHLATSLEILYSQKGSRSTLPKGTSIPNVTITNYRIFANYAEVPVMINYFDKRKSHFGIGISYGRLVNSNEKVQIADTMGMLKDLDFNEKYPFKKDAFDFLAGAQLHLWKGLFLNIRFQYSLIPMRTQLPPAGYARANQYNNLWAVRLMYLFN